MLDDQEQEEGDKDKDEGAETRSYVRGVGEMSIEELRAVSNKLFFTYLVLCDWLGFWEDREGEGGTREGGESRAHDTTCFPPSLLELAARYYMSRPLPVHLLIDVEA